MLGRRLHPRHVLIDSTGTLHVSSEVAVQHRGETELVATADEAHLPGEVFSIELLTDARAAHTHVRVVESCPILVDGSIRHRLRLVPIEERNVEDDKP